MFELSIILHLIFGIIVPICIFVNKFSNSKIQKKENKTWISILKLVGYTVVFLCIIIFGVNYHDISLPDTTSDLCVNSGGWVYSCVGNEKVALIALTIIFVATIIYDKLCEREFYKICGIIQYILLILYLIFMSWISFLLFMCLGGLFVTIHYETKWLELFKIIVMFLPMSLFGLSVYLKLLLQKIKKRSV